VKDGREAEEHEVASHGIQWMKRKGLSAGFIRISHIGNGAQVVSWGRNARVLSPIKFFCHVTSFVNVVLYLMSMKLQ